MNNLDNLYVSVLEKLASINNPQQQVKTAEVQQLDAIYAAVLDKLASLK